ncbi:MAG: 8-amino-7-oxononanoate synthase [Bacteroidetes bacterium]|nr:MAG: 8-amino-7-oxononanoate synthase [Bacteroidota bacterium]
MNFLQNRLAEREQAGTLRTLFVPTGLIDFASNDYLGFARQLACAGVGKGGVGSTGSRLISGNSPEAESLEQFLATFHEAEAGLLFNSGYDANVGLLASLGQANDFYISDSLIHASMIDGIRLSYAQKLKFKHNNLTDLKQKTAFASNSQAGKGNIFIVIESVYSMDGDIAPLQEILDLATETGAYLIIDEAHATGILGRQGEGFVQALGLAYHANILARVHTFGKAVGTHGAVVLGSEVLRNYLINFARSFVYTTALPTHSLHAIREAYLLFGSSFFEQARQNLATNIAHYQRLASLLPYPILASETAIQGIIIGDNALAKKTQRHLQEAGIYAKAILSPTVPQGTERLRICLHSYNTTAEIEQLLETIQKTRTF